MTCAPMLPARSRIAGSLWTGLRRSLIVTGLCLPALTLAAEVRFAAPVTLAVVGQPVEVPVEIHYGAGESADLFSFGVRLVPGRAEGITLKAVQAVEALDHSGFATGALESETVLGIKGNISLAGPELEPYRGSTLASFWIVAEEPGDVALSLDFFRTAGPQEDIFVNTAGQTLDPGLTFGSAVLRVIHPPRLTVERAPDSPDVQVRFQVIPGLRYRLFQSEELREWQEIAAFARDEPGVEVVPVSIEKQPQGFFRLGVDPILSVP